MSCSAGPVTLVVDSSQWASLAELCRGVGGDGEAGGNREARGGQTYGDVAGGEVLVHFQLSDGRPLGGFGMQHALYEVGSQRVDVLWKEMGMQVIRLDKSNKTCVKTIC